MVNLLTSQIDAKHVIQIKRKILRDSYNNTLKGATTYELALTVTHSHCVLAACRWICASIATVHLVRYLDHFDLLPFCFDYVFGLYVDLVNLHELICFCSYIGISRSKYVVNFYSTFLIMILINLHLMNYMMDIIHAFVKLTLAAY